VCVCVCVGGGGCDKTLLEQYARRQWSYWHFPCGLITCLFRVPTDGIASTARCELAARIGSQKGGGI
jgi:hypothetical protein